MKLRWTPEAADDLGRIYSYIKFHHPEFLEKTMKRLYSDIGSLRIHHGSGRPHATYTDCRELLFLPLPYVCIYRVDDYAVTVLQIKHGAQEDAHTIQ